MKYRILLFTLLGSIMLQVHAQNEIGTNIFTYLKNDALILSEQGLFRGEQNITGFISDFTKLNGQISSYSKVFNIHVSGALDYEIGTVTAGSGTFPVMFLKRKDGKDGPKIELLVIYEKDDPANELADIDERRTEWMKLCNAHKAGELVQELYTSDAYYYNRGRLLTGTEAISKEYSYMNSSGYSLKLTPKHVEFISSDIAYEIGRCSGSYPLPYMLLWEKQADGKWMVMMDSNY